MLVWVTGGLDDLRGYSREIIRLQRRLKEKKRAGQSTKWLWCGQCYSFVVVIIEEFLMVAIFHLQISSSSNTCTVYNRIHLTL